MGEDKEPSLETQFAGGTTCHGFNRLADAKNWPHRAFWIVAILWGFGMTTWMIYNRIDAFFKYETSTEIRVEERYSLEFPAVTFCNFNKHWRSAMTVEDWHIYQNYEEARSAALAVNFDVQATTYLASLYKQYEDNVTATYPGGFDIRNFTKRTSWILSDHTMPWCTFRGTRCSIENFTHVFQAEYGSCYTFNANQEPRIETRAGVVQGLTILFDIQQDEYTELLNLNGELGVGINLQVHNWYDRPDVYRHGVGAGRGMLANVALRQNEIQNLEHPWGNCSDKRTLQYFPKFSRSGCETECYLDKIVQHCGCKPYDYPGDAVTCNPVNEVTCAEPVLFDVGSDFKNQCGSRCPEACQIVEYSHTISYVPFPNKYMEREFAAMFGTNASYFGENYVGVNVYYEDLNYRLTKKNPAITPSGLLGDIGGQLGLFIGMSALTLMEFGEYLIFKIIQCCRRRKKSKTSHSQGKPNNGFSKESEM